MLLGNSQGKFVHFFPLDAVVDLLNHIPDLLETIIALQLSQFFGQGWHEAVSVLSQRSFCHIIDSAYFQYFLSLCHTVRYSRFFGVLLNKMLHNCH